MLEKANTNTQRATERNSTESKLVSFIHSAGSRLKASLPKVSWLVKLALVGPRNEKHTKYQSGNFLHSILS